MTTVRPQDVRVGDRIRWTYGDVTYELTAAAVEQVDDDELYVSTDSGTGLYTGDAEIELVERPPVSEPMEPGTLVKAATGGWEPMPFIRTFVGPCPWVSPFGAVAWEQLIDPEILHLGYSGPAKD